MAYHQCSFGAWLEVEGKARFTAQPVFQTIDLSHRQLHELVAELADLHAQGRHSDVLASLPDLHRLQDAFLGQLRLMLRDTAS